MGVRIGWSAGRMGARLGGRSGRSSTGWTGGRAGGELGGMVGRGGSPTVGSGERPSGAIGGALGGALGGKKGGSAGWIRLVRGGKLSSAEGGEDGEGGGVGRPCATTQRRGIFTIAPALPTMTQRHLMGEVHVAHVSSLFRSQNLWGPT